MNTLDKRDVRSILHQLQLLEGNQDFMTQMYPALGGIAGTNKEMIENIRDLILDVSLDSIAVEPVGEA